MLLEAFPGQPKGKQRSRKLVGIVMEITLGFLENKRSCVYHSIESEWNPLQWLYKRHRGHGGLVNDPLGFDFVAD